MREKVCKTHALPSFFCFYHTCFADLAEKETTDPPYGLLSFSQKINFSCNATASKTDVSIETLCVADKKWLCGAYMCVDTSGKKTKQN